MRLLALVGALPLITALSLAAETPQPRVCGTYCSWPQGGYQFRESLDGLFAELGWAYTRVENTQVAALMDDLGRFDIYFPPNLYNYDHAQPFDQYAAKWRAFLERGGILVSCDSNYGSQMGWLTSLGEGLELSSRNCPHGTAAGRDHRIVPVAPEDPFCPDPETTLPWAHFDQVGPGWKVLATCDDGHPVCVRADVGKGVIIAANLHSECGWPTAGYLRRIWAFQAPRVMPGAGEVSLDRGAGAVGGNVLTVSVGGAAEELVVKREVRADSGPWEVSEAPVVAGEARFPYRIAPGRTEVRVEVRRADQALWWTTWVTDTADLPGRLDVLAAKLDGIAPELRGFPADGYLYRRWRELTASCEALQGATEALAQGEAGATTAADWQALADSVADLETCARPLAGRAQVAGRSLRETGDADRPFAVVRSAPLVKLHRDEAPEGPCAGGLQMVAARGEAESLQVGVVPLGEDVTDLNMRLEPLRGPGGAVIGPESSELYRVCYVHVKGPSAGVEAGRDWWPDPLLPAEGSFAAREVCQPLWVDLWVPREAPAGTYRGDLVIWNDAHTERVPVELQVMDFTLPVEHSLRQVFAFRAPQITQRYDGQADYKLATPVETYLRMMDVCLKRRVGVQAFGWEGSPDPVSAMA